MTNRREKSIESRKEKIFKRKGEKEEYEKKKEWLTEQRREGEIEE